MRDAALRRLDVEHAAGAGVAAVDGVVRPELARRVRVPLEPERQRALAGGAADLLVVRAAAVAGRRRLHVALGAPRRRQALAEVLAGGEGRRVHLHLEMALVDVPVADLD